MIDLFLIAGWGKCVRGLERCAVFFGRDSNKANKYAWAMESLESQTLKSRGLKCVALKSYMESEGAKYDQL